MADSSERLSGPEVTALTDQLAGLTAAGLPLAAGLRALGEEVHSRRLGRRLKAVASALDGGASIESALDARRGGLPPHVRGLVAAGVRTGKLGEVLGRFSGYATTGDDLRRDLLLRLLYPTLCLALAISVFLTDGQVRFTMPDGKTMDQTIKAGTTQWTPAGKHLPENMSDTPLELILVEMKGAPAKAK